MNEYGHMTTKEVVSMFDLHRTTAKKYIRIAIERGELIRYGRCVIFRDQLTIITFDLKGFSHTKSKVKVEENAA